MPVNYERFGHHCFRAIFLWCSISQRDPWLSVRSTVGVSRLFTQDGRPVPVPVGIVESLIAQSNGDLTRLDGNLVKGQQVRILSGPFADFVGTLERLDDAGRVQVLLDLMGTAVPVSLRRLDACAGSVKAAPGYGVPFALISSGELVSPEVR